MSQLGITQLFRHKVVQMDWRHCRLSPRASLSGRRRIRRWHRVQSVLRRIQRRCFEEYVLSNVSQVGPSVLCVSFGSCIAQHRCALALMCRLLAGTPKRLLVEHADYPTGPHTDGQLCLGFDLALLVFGGECLITSYRCDSIRGMLWVHGLRLLSREVHLFCIGGRYAVSCWRWSTSEVLRPSHPE